MVGKIEPREVERLFEDIYEFVASRGEVREAVRAGLSRGMKERARAEGRMSDRDVEELLRVRFTKAFPRAAVMHARELADSIRMAFTAWRELSEEVGTALDKKGETWETLFKALDLFLKGPEAVEEMARKDPRTFERYLAVASVAAPYKLNIYSIPVCLKTVFPYADPENAAQYLMEAKRAFALIALARLKEMYDKGSWDEFMLRRLAFLARLVAPELGAGGGTA